MTLATLAAEPAPATRTVVYGRAGDCELAAEHHLAAAHRRRSRAVVMVHGGAWTSNDRHTPHVVCEHLASAGFDVFSLDFRDGRNARHPAAVQDICAGIRHLRAGADALAIDADRIGLVGSSSGGHLALLAALRPEAAEHRGTEVVGTDAQQTSAAVACAVALWPVSDPLARFRHAQAAGRDELLAAHARYFRDEAHMRSASVQRTLNDGEAQALPPLMLVQPGEDANVPRHMTMDLVTAYQNAGGELHYAFYPGLPHAFAYEASPQTTRLCGEIEDFLVRRLV